MTDYHRPRYHFLPRANWMNDPNGIIHWRGRYHLFYQYNPDGALWGNIHWGHAVSSDLVRWEHLPIALAPTPDSADADGCWSGCAVDNDGTVTLLYSGNRSFRQRACLATAADDDLVVWHKYPGNPIIAETPPDLDIFEYRDHAVWREQGVWYQIIGAGVRDVGGAALLYRSHDLLTWEYLHPLALGDVQQRTPLWTGSTWECPSFLALGGGHALLLSVWSERQTLYSVYLTGDYAAHRFTPVVTQKLDYGDNYFYAPQPCVDAHGRTLLWGWLQEGRSLEAQLAAGWSGVMSLPRVLTLRPDGLLGFAPAPELAALRGAHAAQRDVLVAPGHAPAVAQGDTLELDVTLQPGAAARCGLVVYAAPDGAEQTRIVYDRARAWLGIDTTRASRDESSVRDLRGGALALGVGEPLHLRVFLDRSVIEVYANERVCITGRAYPTRRDSRDIMLFAEGGSATLAALDVWELGGIW